VGGIHAQSGLPGRPWPSFMSGGLSRHGWCWSDDDDDTARVDGTQEHMQHVGFLSREDRCRGNEDDKEVQQRRNTQQKEKGMGDRLTKKLRFGFLFFKTSVSGEG
jgi:hypothetical protein